jgi:hypothetical protein
MNHLVSDILKILPNSFQLASQLVKAKSMTFTFGGNNRKLKTNRSKQEFQDAKKISLQHPLTFAMTLLYDLEEHYQRILFPILVTRPTSPAMSVEPRGTTPNECPMKLNTNPVITKASTNPNGREDPTNIPSSSGGDPVCTTNVYARNPVIIEDSVKGLYSLNVRRWRR